MLRFTEAVPGFE